MNEKTFKGRVKKISLYALACAPILLAMGCIAFTIVDFVKGFKYQDEKNQLKEKVTKECLLSADFQSHLEEARKNLIDQLEIGEISPKKYIYEYDKLMTDEVVFEYAKSMPQFESDFELLNYYQKSMDKHGLLCIPGVVSSAISTIWAISSAQKAYYLQDENFDSLSDLDKLDKKMLEKRKKQKEMQK